MTRTNFLGVALLGAFLACPPLAAGERTIPVDIFLMVDKSLSMAESGKFESLHEWVRDQLVGQMLIPGDRISVWQFYGTAEKLLDAVIPADGNTASVLTTIDRIVPDGEYTDIGLALDTIRQAIAGWGDPDRLKILYMLTDLKQEAPWSSRYAGVESKYESPYLAEARILSHGEWFEITLDMDIQDQVVEGTKRLYESILSESSTPRALSLPGATETGDTDATASDRTGNSTLASGEGDGTGRKPDTGPDGRVLDASGSDPSDRVSAMGLPLPYWVAIVIVFSASCAVFIVFMRARSRKARKDKSETTLDRT